MYKSYRYINELVSKWGKTKSRTKMRKEFDIEKLNPRKNPYLKGVNKTITISISEDVIEYFKAKSKNVRIPYQTLINLYLEDCVANDRDISITWH